MYSLIFLHNSNSPFPMLLDQFYIRTFSSTSTNTWETKPTFHYTYCLNCLLQYLTVSQPLLELWNHLELPSHFFMLPSSVSNQFPIGSTSAEVNSVLLMPILHQYVRVPHRNHCIINLLPDSLSLCTLPSDHLLKAGFQYH